MRKTLIAALLGLFVAASAHAEAPMVAVSIKPLHGLVAAVMKGVAEPALIVSGVASPHTYALKPSDARALQAARLVVWVGPRFEGFLARSLAGRTDTLAMADIPGMTLLPAREGGVWEPHAHHGHGDHDEDGPDGHLWLDPANAARLVSAVAERLAALDPAHAQAFRANAAAELARINALDAALKARLAPLAGGTYVVFHDATQYFEHHYGLTPAGSVTVDPDRPPSGRRLAALRDRLKAGKVACVFREPQFAGATMATLAADAGARTGILDPEGTQVPAGPDAWETIMSGLATALTDCLSGG
ncbi:MAG: zinc ABC transporter substrate-binding protein [Actinomycetota bacterium]